jgi:hypothetical protein
MIVAAIQPPGQLDHGGPPPNVPAPKRKTVYRKPPPVKPPIPGVTAPEPYVRPTVAEINTAARHGRTDLAVGDRVKIIGAGLYSGEIVVIERFAGAVIPTAQIRTESGRSRQVRTIDLEPVE